MHRLVFNGRNIANRFEQTAVIEPVYPLKRGVLDFIDVAPRSSLAYDLRFVEAVDRFRQCIIVAVANASDRSSDPGLSQTVAVPDRQILADGGETRLDNLLLLCRHHHRLVHEDGYRLALDAAGEPVFTAPQGERIPEGPDTRFRGNVFALTTANRRERIEIGPGTLVPMWAGERMDDGMAVDGLIWRE